MLSRLWDFSPITYAIEKEKHKKKGESYLSFQSYLFQENPKLKCKVCPLLTKVGRSGLYVGLMVTRNVRSADDAFDNE